MAPPRGKKRKTENSVSLTSQAEETNEIEVEHGSLWFQDGSVVLVAENIGFKVYKGILSQHSEFFQDMFALPQPADGEICEDCPVVRTHDTAKDLLGFLSALHDSMSRYLNHSEILSFDEVSILLRLGAKYQVERMTAEAVRRLKTCFPDKLEDFVNARTDRSLFEAYDKSKFYQTAAISLPFSHCRDVITLAREHDLDSLLPSAFYAYAQMNTEGVVKADTRRIASRMSDADRGRCVDGKFKLKMALRRNLLACLQQVGLDDCLSPQLCLRSKTDRLEYLCHWDVGPWPLMDRSILNIDLAIDFCSVCTTHCNSTYDEKRGETWTNLRKYFDLPPLPAQEPPGGG
ncbi:hypothetical protein EIP91_000489 [Steccherinum ochraceum]|uniref:BTB domain-containing protein n=1 Tax=Steccherinum ochraceum TaxID=92696 RepID=A0A4R0RQF5_9APHY|nr:hypothetical protein EIP91_000489 [Steccherinum ochraceum]